MNPLNDKETVDMLGRHSWAAGIGDNLGRLTSRRLRHVRVHH